MPAIRTALFTAAVFLLLTVLAGAQSQVTSIGDRDLQNARLTHAAISRDGTRIAAAWFVRARNRPGTDWRTGVCVWDLESGNAGMLPDATGPVEISPDGQQVLATTYARPPRAMRPVVSGPALWSFDRQKLLTEFRPPGKNFQPFPPVHQPSGLPLLAATFHPDGNHIVVCTTFGALLTWDVDRPGDVTCCDVLHFESDVRGWGNVPTGGILRFESSNSLYLLKLPTSLYQEQRLTCFVRWRVDMTAGRFERVGADDYDPLSTDPQSGEDITFQRRNAGHEIVGTDPAGNQIIYDFETFQVVPAFVSPDGRYRLTSNDDGWFVLPETGSNKPVYRLPLGQPAEQLESKE